ncbi:hypothetical protein GQ44DRAFT_732312 [Phaeosphaeriaceae sp. PMI808]|nr:hypothetical protein GQ44DRAFT_732312 [Phaeosphaeriaceae sp. PMI808]
MFLDDVDETPMKAAVTTCNARDCACSIITSYNRPPLEPTKPYKWLQARDDYLHVKTWKLLAIEEARIFWGLPHVSGKATQRAASSSYRFMRLDPSLNISVISLDDFEAIPRLQQSSSDMLRHDIAFIRDYAITGMIRPCLPATSLQHLYHHRIYRSLHFMVNGKPLAFAMPKKLSVRVKDLSSPIEVLLCDETHKATISGLPMSITDILQAQQNFYRRKGTRKRRII